jgi:hypothetical protein
LTSEIAPSTSTAPNSDGERLRALTQFYSIEYTAIMNRVALWINLQYALWPIVLVSLGLLAQFRNAAPPHILTWVAAAVLPVAFLAYLSAMLDGLQYVLFIERVLRPSAARLVDTAEFWIWERAYRRTRPYNLAYGQFWPVVFCILSVSGGTFYRYGMGDWFDFSGDVIVSLLIVGVSWLCILARRLNLEISAVTRVDHM